MGGLGGTLVQYFEIMQVLQVDLNKKCLQSAQNRAA
uniref:Uncharacterized protein n=1 Tax=Anguilla anguilla TaxID=7936 RepID=A0A0E9TEZ2_ANGAN